VTSYALWGKLFKQQSALHMRICYWPNLKSVAQIIFKIFGIVCHKFLPVTWPRPRSFWGKLLARPLGFSKRRLSTKFEDSSWSNFEDMFECMPKRLEVTWPRPSPFWRKLFERLLGFHQTKRCTKFDISSSSSFEDMFNRIPKILGVTWPEPRPFGGKLFERSLGFSKRKLCTKLEVSNSSSFEDMFNRIPKILGSRDLGHAPFGKNYLSARSAFHRWSCIPNLKSLAQVVLKICSTVCQKF